MASKLTSQEMSDLPLRLLADEIEIIVCTTLGILLCVYLIPDFFYTMWNIFWETMLFGMKITIVGISLIYFYFKLVAWPDARAEDVSVEKYSRWKCFLSPIPNAGIRVAELLLKMFHASEKTPAATAADRRNVHFATPERTIIYYEQTDDERLVSLFHCIQYFFIDGKAETKIYVRLKLK